MKGRKEGRNKEREKERTERRKAAYVAVESFILEHLGGSIG